MGKLNKNKKDPTKEIIDQQQEAIDKALPKIPKFPKAPEKDGGKSGKEKKTELTKEQKNLQVRQEILQQQEMLNNNGIYRLNRLDLITMQNNLIAKQTDTFIELGQHLLDEVKGCKEALQKLAEQDE